MQLEDPALAAVIILKYERDLGKTYIQPSGFDDPVPSGSLLRADVGAAGLEHEELVLRGEVLPGEVPELAPGPGLVP